MTAPYACGHPREGNSIPTGRMIARVGKALWRAYLNSVLWFTLGVTAGGCYVAAILVAHGVVR
jgi:hypothetical protein